MCADGGVDALTLSTTTQPEQTFYPNLLEGELLLSLAPSESDTTNGTEGGDAYGGSCGGTGGRVVWSVSYRPSPDSAQDEDDWTVFPSTGLLLPGERWGVVAVGCNCPWLTSILGTLRLDLLLPPSRRKVSNSWELQHSAWGGFATADA